MSDPIRPKASGYSEAGASKTRRALKGFTARSASPNEDINWNNYTLRQRGRMLYMSSPIAASAINTNRTKIVGSGLTLKSAINHEALGLTPEQAKEWQRNTEAEFALWAEKRENIDATAMNDFAGIQQLAVLSWLMNGDVFALFQRDDQTPINPYTLRVHLIEADRVCTPRTGNETYARMTDGKNAKTGNAIYDGVEVDNNGRVVAYHICNGYPGNHLLIGTKMEWVRVRAFGRRTGMPNVLHVMSSERPDQYRGVTYLAPVIESLLNISRYTQSELMAALIQSFFTAWITTETDPTQLPIAEVGSSDATDHPTPDSNISNNPAEYEMGPGTVTHLQPGEKIQFGNPNIPSQGFDAFTKVISKEIGAALEIPYDTLLKEFNSSYSASRAALMEAFEAFKMRRSWLVSKLCQPIYEAWLAEAVATGRIKAPGFFSDPKFRAAWCKARWIGPVQGQLDPTKEVKADILAVDHGFKTHEQVTREYGGGVWDENVEQLKHEKEALGQMGAVTDPTVADPKPNDPNDDGGNDDA